MVEGEGGADVDDLAVLGEGCCAESDDRGLLLCGTLMDKFVGFEVFFFCAVGCT